MVAWLAHAGTISHVCRTPLPHWLRITYRTGDLVSGDTIFASSHDHPPPSSSTVPRLSSNHRSSSWRTIYQVATQWLWAIGKMMPIVMPIIMMTVQIVVVTSSVERSPASLWGIHRDTLLESSPGCSVHLPASPEVVATNIHSLVGVLEERFCLLQSMVVIPAIVPSWNKTEHGCYSRINTN